MWQEERRIIVTKNRNRLWAVIAIVFIMFLVIALAVPFEKNNVYYLSLIFGIVAIVVQCVVMKIAFGKEETPKSKFYGFPIAKIGFVYMAAQVILSFVFMAISKNCPTWIVVIIFVVLLGVSFIGFIAAEATRDTIEKMDNKLKNNTECMQNLRSIVYPLSGQAKDAKCKEELDKLAEEFKYSDPVSSEAIKNIENELSEMVDELQKAVVDNDSESIIGLCDKIKISLTERNRLCKLNKRNQ